MKIARVTAIPLNLPVAIKILGMDKQAAFSAVHVEIETDTGIVGHGFTAITEEEAVAAVVNLVAAPNLIGEDPMAHEKLWDKLYWLMAPRGQTGYALHAIAALDIALWDIKGKALGQPLWRLFGGARNRVPLYATFGFSFFDRDQLAAAAKLWVEQGFTKLKMVVGHEGLQRRDTPRPLDAVIREDLARIRAVREAVGDGIDLVIDANCSLDYVHAERLARMAAPYNLMFFEEPVTQNDPRRMAELRRRTGLAVGAGQNEGLAYRFRDFLVADAVDYVQPNACITGGFTQCLRIAGMAQAFNVTFANGGAWPHHNMHLHGGLAQGGLVEYHYAAVEACRTLYRGLPQAENGWLTLPDLPGLGFEPDRDALNEIAKRPPLKGRGKG
ncbi:MAG: mandelate racemase/muconate lactonizing enzyme family protein [Rhodospirillaceae bacterium]|nr:mandelate racemase/muconate lactonizing enzyme family protein [Rhodospirillaceae bacterium]